MKYSRGGYPQTYVTILIGLVVILCPLLLALAWGQHFSGDVYTILRLAREMANGAGIAIHPVGDFPPTSLNSPFFASLLSIPARIGIEPSWAVLILSAMGWSVAALAILAIGQSLKQFRGAVISVLLLSFNPTIITTLGSSTSWIVALGWLTLALLWRRRAIAAAFTFLLLAGLLIPLSLSGGWSPYNQHLAAIAWSILLFAAGVGVDWLADELVNNDLIRLTAPQAETSLLAVAFIFIGIWQGIRLWQLFEERPEIVWQLEEAAASWLRSETNPTATVLADDRIGYLSQRPAATLPNLPQHEVATAVQSWLKAQPVAYLVTTNELTWQQLQELVWFRLAYEPVKQFNLPNLPQAPLTIWAYRDAVAELGPRHAINARVPDRLAILGYQIGPEQVQPGDPVQMALYFQAPEATNVPAIPFQAIVRLISPVDGQTVSEWNVNLPQSVLAPEWQPSDVLLEQFPLLIPDDLEAGAYQFNLSLMGSDSAELWPISWDKDINRLDRIPIGGLIIPWEGALENTQPIGAVFAEQIELTGFAIREPEPGRLLDVTLIWEAQKYIDSDYIVFVHVVSSDGELAASNDSRPANGRFPTSAWLPGIVIPDTHSIPLPDNLDAGEYQLKVGLYRPETGERLSAATATGENPEDNALLVTTFFIP